MYIDEIRFSLWLDFLEREFILKDFQKVIEQYKITGATSNPAIFKEAILKSPAYQEQLQTLQDKDPKGKYEALAIKDIQMAADVLKPLYEKGDDGFVSIEVDPRLAHDAQGTIKEAKRLYDQIGRDNVMIKIPVTPAGCEAIEELVASGIHVNATLIFSPYQARECLDAMERGSRKNPDGYKVLSVFVSRFDRKLDPILQSKDLPTGKVGIMNAAKIYNMITKRDIPKTRTLFASTGVKGSAYPAHYYISNLVAPDSVNTAPLHTIEAFAEDGDPKPKLPIQQEEIDQFFTMLKAHEIDMKQVYHDLLQEGLKAFEEAFEAILQELK
ncbi:transaldolase [Nitratiruptor sp. SB155-2]|uniref:transaldolase n=1 Tax=Nitratiruptor sp. (strain SB155-2) TaxID=387092 RepID=UPI0001586E95|nr:transaldolase [Nitratiruptor sp. SB155-2]BAF69496.1 transaldolase [Nitratiruptor sp. SB155-2]